MLLAAGSLQATAQARTWIVDRQGNGDFTTIQPAVNAASPGDTILLHAGRYLEYAPYDAGALTEDTYVVLEKPDLTLRGVDRDSVIIGPSTYEWTTTNEPNGIFVALNATGCTIESLTIENIPTASEQDAATTMRDVKVNGTYWGIVSYSQGACFFEQLELQNCSRHCIGLWRRAQSSIIRDSEFRGYSTGVLVSGVENLLIDECNFREGAVVSFQFGGNGTIVTSTFEPGGVVVHEQSSAVLTNCTFDANRDPNLQVIYGSARVYRSRLAECETASIGILSHENAEFSENDLLNEYTYLGPETVYASHCCADSGTTVNFERNWWGTTDSSQIAQWILDANDQPSRNVIVDFEPFLSQSVPNRKSSLGDLKSKFSGKRE